MTDLLTAARMRAIEKAAIDSGEVTGLALMERAGRGVVEAVFEAWPELAKTDRRAVVLCGPGNNGGDGFVVARLLRDWGWAVAVHLFGDAGKLPPDARLTHDRWCETGDVTPFGGGGFTLPADTDLVVDALFGTGLSRPADPVPALIAALDAAARRPWVVAVDMPSGLCSDSGYFLGPRKPDRFADLTVTFHRAKTGHCLGDAARYCGRVVVKDIGLSISPKISPPEARHPPVRLVDRSMVRTPGLRKADGHKYGHGHALILSGPAGRTGAARLAARGALRIGAGLVTVACPPEALAEHAAQLNAIMLAAVNDAGALADLLRDGRTNALCLGPALGTDARAKSLVMAALSARRPTVLDADALTGFSNDPKVLLDALHPDCVLTPHAGEFARLFPGIAGKLDPHPNKGPAYSRVDAAREAAARAGCVVLFKGPDTVIAAPDGRCLVHAAFHDRAAPWLATAGSGDVLAGFIAGLLARGYDPMRAAATAAWLHVECARGFGPGLIAEDLPEQLPGVFRDLGV